MMSDPALMMTTVAVIPVIGRAARQATTWPLITAAEVPIPAAVGAAAAAGLAVALSLPPFGWWPLAIVGVAALAALLPGRTAGRRAVLGAAFGLGQFAIGLWWVTEFNVGGYVALVLLAMVATALAGAVVPARRPIGVLVGLPAALALGEWVRGQFPFGGLPLGGIPLGQAASPLVAAARLGGPVLLTWITAAAGAGLTALVAALAAPAPRPRERRRQDAVAAAVVLSLVTALVIAGRLSPDGTGSGPRRTLMVAAVQGGGPRGTSAGDVDTGVVMQRQVDATTALHPPIDLVVWPEDVVTVDQPIAQAPEGATVGHLAQRLGSTVVAGVVENVGTDRFRNAAVAWSPAGVIVARYDKVHRVPFGEYIPGRGFFQHLANLERVPRDAIAGRGPGLLDTPVAPLGTVISYEVFFEGRARSAIRAGGEVLLVPTNASSYSTSQVPTQEMAAAQLRAWETGRDVVQAAPTGYSALIDHDGRVRARSTLGQQQVITGTVTLRRGQTVFLRLGDLPVVVLAILALIASLGRRRGPG
jgi:apolipoprotein N-acyltransferase